MELLQEDVLSEHVGQEDEGELSDPRFREMFLRSLELDTSPEPLCVVVQSS